jgi:hypothetical protein
MTKSFWPFFSMVLLVAGCASTPDVVYKYYPSQAQSTVTVTQTIDCTSDKTALIVVSTPALNTLYTANYRQPPSSVRVKDLAGAIADSDLSFNFFDDGRLKSVNASSTGQGEAVVKSAVSLITAVAAIGGGVPVGAPVKAPALPECTTVNNWGNGKPVTLTYGQIIDFNKAAAGPVDLEPTPQSAPLWGLLKNQLSKLAVFVRSQTNNDSGAYYDGVVGNRDAIFLTLQRTANVQVDVLAKGSSIFSTTVALPLPATYQLAIPKAAVFGKQSFSLTLAESGAVTAVDYGKLSGASGALNAATSAAGAAAPESTANKAAELKAQADLIVQQQRLARCQAQPDKCT